MKSYLQKINLGFFLFNAELYKETLEKLNFTDSEQDEIKSLNQSEQQDIMLDVTILRLISDINLNKTLKPLKSIKDLHKLINQEPTTNFQDLEKVFYLTVASLNLEQSEQSVLDELDFIDKDKLFIYSEMYKLGEKVLSNNTDTIKTNLYVESKSAEEKEQLFNAIYKALEQQSYTVDILINDYEKYAVSVAEKRLLEYFKIRASIIKSDFEYGKQALINLYNLKNFNSENIFRLVDTNNGVVMFISKFRQKGYKFNETELTPLYEKAREIVYNTPYELSLFIEKSIFDSENNHKQSIKNDYIQIKDRLKTIVPENYFNQYDNLIDELIK
jgi:hypothetical protein